MIDIETIVQRMMDLESRYFDLQDRYQELIHSYETLKEQHENWLGHRNQTGSQDDPLGKNH